MQRDLWLWFSNVPRYIESENNLRFGGPFFKYNTLRLASVPQHCKSNLIYKYTCERCKAFYIGKTEQQLAARISEHSGISARTGKKLQTKPRSDIYDHCQNCHVHVQPENFSIIDTLPTEKGLLILESLHQKIKKPQIGIHQKSTPIMSFD